MKKLTASKKFRIYKAARRELGSRFPNAFPWHGRRPPLKIGIFDDIRREGLREISLSDCRLFLRIWTNSTAYLTNIKEGCNRVCLDGRCGGTVSLTHASEAIQTLRERQNRERC